MTTGQSDILTKLADDARRLRVARKLPDEKLSWDWVRRIQDDLSRFIEETSYSLQVIAKKLGRGCSPATLSMFRSAKSSDEFNGDFDRIARAINQFIETETRRREVPRPAGWVETDVAKRMLSLIQNTIEMRSIGVIFSDAGRGKTMTLQAAASIYQQAILVRVRSTARNAFGLAKLIAAELRLKGVRTFFDVEAGLIDTLKGSDRPLLIDEAHQLKTPALEFLRDLHDACGIPIVFAGTRTINDKLTDTDEFFGQFNRRTALRYDVLEEHSGAGSKSPRPLHTVAEIRRIWQSDKLRLTDDGAVTLAKLSNIPGLGGLGAVAQIVLVASRLAGESPIDAALVLRVIRKMQGQSYAIDHVQRALDETRVKVA